MIELHVTNTIFELYKNGNKKCEYREYKPYWIKRFSNVNPPLMANIVRGYTTDKIPVKIMKINLITKDRIKEPLYGDFIRTNYCYELILDIN